MEGIPEQSLVTLRSTTYNMLNLWKPLTATPKFNYGAFRYNTPDHLSRKEMFQYYRLGFAQSVYRFVYFVQQLADASRDTQSARVVRFRQARTCGAGWGNPFPEARFLAAEAPDQLNGMGNPMCPEISDRCPFASQCAGFSGGHLCDSRIYGGGGAGDHSPPKNGRSLALC